jgi:hypothetical protein
MASHRALIIGRPRSRRQPYAGNNLDKARKLFADAIKHRPRIRLMIRQRTRVLEQWPLSNAWRC